MIYTDTPFTPLSKEDFDSVITYDKDTSFTVLESIDNEIITFLISEYLKMVSTGVNL